MWNMLFALFLSGVFVTAGTDNNSIWFILFTIAAHICVVGIIITNEKQKEKIETLEEKVKQLEKTVGDNK